jgi:hypothetical protein
MAVGPAKTNPNQKPVVIVGLIYALTPINRGKSASI